MNGISSAHRAISTFCLMGGRRAAGSPTTLRLTLTERKFVFARGLCGEAAGANLAITRAAAIDHVEEGVRVNCIAPGTVDTPWIGRITAGYDAPEEARRNMQARQPHGRLVAPEEIAAMAAYLASDEAASVIGACMIVDGGVTAR